MKKNKWKSIKIFSPSFLDLSSVCLSVGCVARWLGLFKRVWEQARKRKKERPMGYFLHPSFSTLTPPRRVLQHYFISFNLFKEPRKIFRLFVCMSSKVWTVEARKILIHLQHVLVKIFHEDEWTFSDVQEEDELARVKSIWAPFHYHLVHSLTHTQTSKDVRKLWWVLESRTKTLIVIKMIFIFLFATFTVSMFNPRGYFLLHRLHSPSTSS